MPEDDARSRRRRTFGPVVLLGLATAALAAVAAAKPWLASGTGGGAPGALALDQGTRSPVASSVSLVLLAAWGVLLVTRGVVRRAFAVVAVVAALGLVAAVVVGHATLPDAASGSLEQALGRGGTGTGFTGWFWTTAVCAVLAVAPALLAVRLAPHWPEMSRRYDAPGAAATPAAQDGAIPGADSAASFGTDSERDLWHALDEGRDPTDDGRAATDTGPDPTPRQG
jgi:uncharacterized membrane protein (TIGR02234 family)